MNECCLVRDKRERMEVHDDDNNIAANRGLRSLTRRSAAVVVSPFSSQHEDVDDDGCGRRSRRRRRRGGCLLSHSGRRASPAVVSRFRESWREREREKTRQNISTAAAFGPRRRTFAACSLGEFDSRSLAMYFCAARAEMLFVVHAADSHPASVGNFTTAPRKISCELARRRLTTVLLPPSSARSQHNREFVQPTRW